MNPIRTGQALPTPGQKYVIPIQVGNITSRVHADEHIIKKLLRPQLRFRPTNFRFDPLYKRKLWDGFTDFIDDQGHVLSGLVPQVARLLESWGYVVQYDLTACGRAPWKRPPTKSIVRVRDRDGVLHDLRDVQFSALRKSYAQGRGLIQVGTGGGKTGIIGGLISMTMADAGGRPAPTLILVRSKTLAKQIRDDLRSMGVPHVGMVHGECFEPDVVTVCLTQSIEKIKDMLPFIDLLIADEVHESLGDQSAAVYMKLVKTWSRFGLSGSIFKTKDNVHNYKALGYFGELLEDIPTLDLQKMDILAESLIHIHQFGTPDDEKYRELDYFTAYDLLIVNNTAYHQKVSEIARSMHGRTIIFVENIDHGDQLHAMNPDFLWVQGKDNDETRSHIREQLRIGEGDIRAISTRIFVTGIDLFVHGIINAAGGKSEQRLKQGIGRGLRKAEDKERLDFHDFYFTNNKFLENQSKERMKIFYREGHQFQIEGERVGRYAKRVLK